MEKEDLEMNVVNVDFVENEMVELDVVQIGLNWGWIEVECGDESDYDGDECGDTCGDGHAKKMNFTGFPFHTKLTTLFPPNNQSKPIVPIPFLSLLFLSFPSITFRYTFYNFSLYFQFPLFPSYTFSLSLL